MAFDLCNHFLKIREFIRTPSPKVGVTWECEGSFSHTLLHFWEDKMCFSGFLLVLHFCKPLCWS